MRYLILALLIILNAIAIASPNPTNPAVVNLTNPKDAYCYFLDNSVWYAPVDAVGYAGETATEWNGVDGWFRLNIAGDLAHDEGTATDTQYVAWGTNCDGVTVKWVLGIRNLVQGNWALQISNGSPVTMIPDGVTPYYMDLPVKNRDFVSSVKLTVSDVGIEGKTGSWLGHLSVTFNPIP